LFLYSKVLFCTNLEKWQKAAIHWKGLSLSCLSLFVVFRLTFFHGLVTASQNIEQAIVHYAVYFKMLKQMSTYVEILSPIRLNGFFTKRIKLQR
jgi:hypothetical protein